MLAAIVLAPLCIESSALAQGERVFTVAGASGDVGGQRHPVGAPATVSKAHREIDGATRPTRGHALSHPALGEIPPLW
jgi:hypothetical protein